MALFCHRTVGQWKDSCQQDSGDGGVPLCRISAYSYNAYHVTHSLIVWSYIASGLWLRRRKFSWVFAASAFHILCGIPLHTLRYFPTQYLWPLPTPLHDGIHWANPIFMLVNYFLIVLTYLFIRVQKTLPKSQMLRKAHPNSCRRGL